MKVDDEHYLIVDIKRSSHETFSRSPRSPQAVTVQCGLAEHGCLAAVIFLKNVPFHICAGFFATEQAQSGRSKFARHAARALQLVKGRSSQHLGFGDVRFLQRHEEGLRKILFECTRDFGKSLGPLKPGEKRVSKDVVAQHANCGRVGAGQRFRGRNGCSQRQCGSTQRQKPGPPHADGLVGSSSLSLSPPPLALCSLCTARLHHRSAFFVPCQRPRAPLRVSWDKKRRYSDVSPSFAGMAPALLCPARALQPALSADRGDGQRFSPNLPLVCNAAHPFVVPRAGAK